MTIDIAEMTIADYDEVLALWESIDGLGVHPDESDSRERIAKYLARNPGMCFVARDAAAPVAAVLCGTDGRRGYLHHLAVVASHRRRGLATALVGRCINALQAMGIPRCNLFVYADNELAAAFWRRLGGRCWDEFGVKVMTLNIS